MDVSSDIITAKYAIQEATRKAVCVMRAVDDPYIGNDRLAHGLGVDYSQLTGLEQLLFELVADSAVDFMESVRRPKSRRGPPSVTKRRTA